MAVAHVRICVLLKELALKSWKYRVVLAECESWVYAAVDLQLGSPGLS